jgi:hypothetical protein
MIVHNRTSRWYKCNVDAAFHQAINKTSTIWCLRDHLGCFVAAETTWLAGNYSIMKGEASALYEALKAMHIRSIKRGWCSSSSSRWKFRI